MNQDYWAEALEEQRVRYNWRVWVVLAIALGLFAVYEGGEAYDAITAYFHSQQPTQVLERTQK